MSHPEPVHDGGRGARWWPRNASGTVWLLLPYINHPPGPSLSSHRRPAAPFRIASPPHRCCWRQRRPATAAMIATSVLYAVAGLWLLPRRSAAQCFNLDGSQVTEPDFVPCNPTPGAISMCCALNRRAANEPREVCTANGLCQSTGVDAQNVRRDRFVRESCTRPDWAGCLRDVCPRAVTVSSGCAGSGTASRVVRRHAGGARVPDNVCREISP